MRKISKRTKLTLNTETIAELNTKTLGQVVGGANGNTGAICVDTDRVTNCRCTGQSFFCPTVSCPPAPL